MKQNKSITPGFATHRRSPNGSVLAKILITLADQYKANGKMLQPPFPLGYRSFVRDCGVGTSGVPYRNSFSTSQSNQKFKWKFKVKLNFPAVAA
jgi:hypothetical protein